MKYWSIMLLCGLLVCACSKDDDEIKNEAGNQGKRLVSRITMSSGRYSDDIKFTYDKGGRIVKVEDWYTETEEQFETSNIGICEYYFENGILSKNTISQDMNTGETETTISDLGLSGKGFVNRCWLGYLNYNQNNYVMDIRDSRDSSKVIYSFYWRDGNIDRIEDETSNSNWKFEWMPTENKCNIDFFYLLEWCQWEEGWFLDALGYYGKANKNLLRRAENGRNVATYSYSYDKEGYVTKIIRTEGNDSERCTIEYKD